MADRISNDNPHWFGWGSVAVSPEEEDRKKGLNLRVYLSENKETVTESIFTHPFKFESIEVQEGIFGVFNGQTVFMKDLIREVIGIPMNNRAEALMQYEIRKTKKEFDHSIRPALLPAVSTHTA